MPEAPPASDATVQTGATDSGQTIAASTTAQVQDGTAGSSTATQGDKPKSMLEAVTAAVKPTEADASPASQAGTDQADKAKEPAGQEGSKDELSEDPTDEELAQVNERTAKRMRKLLSQRNEARGQIETLKGDAETGRMVTEYVAKANLSPDEVNSGFEIMRLMKADPFKALEMMAPYWNALQSITGKVLPPDLQQAVDEGKVTEAFAREIVENRAKATVSTQRVEQTQQQTEQERQQREHRAHVDRISQAGTDFENQWQRSDPDYKLKAARVHEKVELVLRRDGFFKTEADAISAIKKAIKEVEADLATLRPAQKQLTPITGGGSASQSKPAPKTMRELVDRAASGG